MIRRREVKDDDHHASLARNVRFPTPVAGEEDGLEPTYVRDRGCICGQQTVVRPSLGRVRYIYRLRMCVQRRYLSLERTGSCTAEWPKDQHFIATLCIYLIRP